MFEIELRYSIEMTLFRIYKFFKLFILYLKYSTHMKNLHKVVKNTQIQIDSFGKKC